MDSIRKFEATAAGWYKNAPHLPKGFTQWLADNIWWLVIIGVALSVLSLFALIPLTLVAIGFSAALLPGSGVASSDGLANVFWLSAIITLATIIMTTILEAIAIGPLKNKAKNGWSLLFIVAIINVVSSIITSLIALNIISILIALLWAAIWGYFLYEIRGYFGARKVETKVKKKA